MSKLFLLFSSPKPIGQLESKCIEIGRLATSLLILTDNTPLLQVLANGQKRLQKPSIPQLDSRIHCSALLLPSVQECKDQQSLKVSLCFCSSSSVNFLLFILFLYRCRDIEMLALFVACLCHDIDHRGTTNSFQVSSVGRQSWFSRFQIEQFFVSYLVVLLTCFIFFFFSPSVIGFHACSAVQFKRICTRGTQQHLYLTVM